MFCLLQNILLIFSWGLHRMDGLAGRDKLPRLTQPLVMTFPSPDQMLCSKLGFRTRTLGRAEPRISASEFLAA